MGRESASYFLASAPQLEAAVVTGLRGCGAEPAPGRGPFVGLRVSDPYRYWIDLRLHRAPEARLEVRIALTNDEWSIRAPLERVFAGLPPQVARGQLRDEDGLALGAPGERGWSLRVEADFGVRRAEFIASVGDFTAPICADHVYLYIHQACWSRDRDMERRWEYEREVCRLEQMWDHPVDDEPQLPPRHPDAPVRADEG